MLGCVQKIIKSNDPCYDCIEDYLNSTWALRDSDLQIMANQKMEKSSFVAVDTSSKRGSSMYLSILSIYFWSKSVNDYILSN